MSSSDAVNVLACAAGTQLGIPTTVARVEDPVLKAEVEAKRKERLRQIEEEKQAKKAEMDRLRAIKRKVNKLGPLKNSIILDI